MKIALTVSAALLSGCALFPISESECRPASWEQRGYNDGYFGNIPQDIRLAQECDRRYGIQIAQAEYLVGWRAGYDEYDRLIGSFKKNR